jgi:iron complex outermembrane recepter protein
MSDLATSLRRPLLVAFAAGSLVFSAAGAAQDAQQEEDKKDNAEQTVSEVVVTGSRVRRDEFTSAAPVQVITREGSVLAGLSTTKEILQGSTTSGGGNQINNYFGGFVTEGGPGANTVSLRGLGAIRTLVLLNGRRLGPAGTRGQVGSADLNVLPGAIVDRIEILKDGASSIYGSDAVAGVVNVITSRGLNDFTFETSLAQTFDGGGDRSVYSAVGGFTGERWEITGSLEFAERKNLEVGQRDWASCSTEYLIDPSSGARLDQIDTRTGEPRCFPISGLAGTNGVAHNYIVAAVVNAAGTALAGQRWEPTPGTTGFIPGWTNVDDPLAREFAPEMLLRESLISPAKSSTAFVTGSYDLRALGDAELYFEALYTRRESDQIGARQLSLDYVRGSPLVPEPFRSTPVRIGVNPAGVALAGGSIVARSLIAFGTDTSSQQVDYLRVVGGFRGDLTWAGDWKYDAYVNYNLSDAQYTFQSFLTDRVYNSLDVVVAPTGTTAPTRTVGGVSYTCRVNTTNPAAGCVPAPAVDAVSLGGTLDNAYRGYIFRPVTGKTIFEEATFSAIFDGSLFDMPAGMAKGAVGLEYRTSRINDTPSIDSINQNLYNLTSGGITKGDDSVAEVFLEIELPLLRNLAFAKDLTFNASGRYTDYDSYGSDETFKLGLNYAPFNWLKFRATKGTSYRAPGVFEQFLSPTSGFLSAQNDPCNNYGTLPVGSIRRTNCEAELPGNPTFLQSSGIRVDAAGGAAQGLASETSEAATFGVVFQPTLAAAFGDLQIALDWWKIDIEDQVNRIGGGGLLRLCYDDPDFRAGGRFCSFVDPRTPGGNLRVQDNFINIAEQKAEGLDWNIRYSRGVGTGTLRLDLRATDYILQDDRLFPTDPFDQNNGTLFSPEWVGDFEARYDWREWTFRYGLTYVGAMDSYEFFGLDPASTPFQLAVSEYITHSASVRYLSKNKWQVLAGITNLTDEEPKKFSSGVTSLRQGDGLLYSGYDFFGRTAFLTLSKTF